MWYSYTNEGGFWLVDMICRKMISQQKDSCLYPETPNHYDLLTVDEQLRFIAMCYDTIDEYDRKKMSY